MTITTNEILDNLSKWLADVSNGYAGYHRQLSAREIGTLLKHIDTQAGRIAELEYRESRVTKLVFDSSESWHLLADKWAKAEHELVALREHVIQPYKLNSPEIPDGLIVAINHLLDVDGSRGCYSAVECHDAREKVERLLAAAPEA